MHICSSLVEKKKKMSQQPKTDEGYNRRGGGTAG